MVRIALVDNSTLTAVQRVLGHAPVRDRSVVDGDLVALEGLVQTVLFYDHVFFLDDYKERHRPQRRAEFARLLPLKPTPDAYARLVECARGAAEQIVPRVEGGVFTDEDFRPFFDLLQMNVVFTWDMASSEYFLTVKMLEGASGVDLDKYGRLMSMIYADLADKRRTGQSVDAKQAAQLVDSRGRPIPYPHPETYRKDFHLTKEVMTFFTGLSWLAFRTVLYTLLARQLGVDLVLHPIRQAFQANTLTRLRLEEPSGRRSTRCGPLASRSSCSRSCRCSPPGWRAGPATRARSSARPTSCATRPPSSRRGRS
jgi:hypothetical protein